MQVYLNGSYLKHTEAVISVSDRGFVFGDGIYEVIRVVEGRFIKEQEHYDRLDEGLTGLGIELDQSIREDLPAISRELIDRNSLGKGQAKLYLQITRGSAWPRTHVFPDPAATPTVYLSAESFTPHSQLHEEGVDVISVSDVRWARCNLKTVNLLPNTLVKQQARDAGVNSAVMIRDGMVTESPNANVFGVKNGTLYTYPLSNYILSGITRGIVLDIADELAIPVVQKPISEQMLFKLDELFFSGTTTDIQPINRVDGKEIGAGKPGPVVRQIQNRYHALLTG